MAFTVKEWSDSPDAGSATSLSPLTSAGIEDLELRLSNYTDSASYTKTAPTIASATALTLTAVNTDFYLISGTTTITSVVATGHTGRVVSLKFLGILTFTDGSNLNLAGDLVSQAGDTITIACDGTNWNEVARSVNS